MRVTFLGTGTSTGVPVLTCRCSVCTSTDPRDKRLRPSVLLEWDGASVLIDTGTDLREQGLRHDLRRVDAVLYTHAHADHVLGLDELRLFNWKQRGAIPVYGSALTLSMIRRTFWYVFEEVQIGRSPSPHAKEIRAGSGEGPPPTSAASDPGLRPNRVRPGALRPSFM